MPDTSFCAMLLSRVLYLLGMAIFALFGLGGQLSIPIHSGTVDSL
ncbi:MAG: hypothetical protein ACPG4B_04355 [Cycloclasticus sp.]